METKHYKFAELHAHDEISNLRGIDSCIKTQDLVRGAYNKGLNGIAITNHESLGSHIKAIEEHARIVSSDDYDENRGFKVLFGNEIYLNETREPLQKHYYHFVLIAKDEVGYKQLKILSTEAWTHSFKQGFTERVITTYDDIRRVVGADKGHLIASTACLGSYLGSSILNLIDTGNEDIKNDIHNYIQFCLENFGDDFYIELQAGKSEEQIEYNKIALTLTKAYGLKHVITNDVHYLEESDKELHSAYLKSRDSERETEAFYNSTFMKAPEEMLDWLEYLDLEDIEQGFANTMEIHEKCKPINLFVDIIVPRMDLPEFELSHLFKDHYDKYEFLNRMAHSQFKEDRYLLWGVEKGFLDKEQEMNETNLARLDVECQQLLLISENLGTNMSSYYNLVDKIVDIIWQVSYVGVARGSVTGFYICYLLDISQLNPIEHNLPYWRHIHHSKVALADIDLDSEASKRQIIFDLLKDFFGWNRCLNIATFKTEGSRSSILTSCRGLGIHHDIGQELADYVKIERGVQWSLSDCWFGNEEKERAAVPGFLEKVEQFPLLKETALKIEGLICGRSIHASGFYIFDTDFIDYNSAMKAPNGQLTTAWNMDDSDKLGGLKVDILTIEALDKEHLAIDFLIEENIIEDKGSIRDNYNAYLHPDTLDYTSKEMWDKLGNGEINSVFQFDTEIGSQGIKKIKPTTLKQLAITNSVMRLKATEDGETPIDKYVRYKDDSEWLARMMQYKLTQSERHIIIELLGVNNMLSAEQEDVMEIIMHPKLFNGGMKLADKVRKVIAKKKLKEIDNIKEELRKTASTNNMSENLFGYIWDECMAIQMGYSFSRNHTMPYSAIALQEMNIYNKYNPIYWNTAVLTVNASATDSDGDNKNTDYGKIANAIGDMQGRGIEVQLPDINTSRLGFAPSVEDNSILFGLKGVNGIGDSVVLDIIENRPYSSIENFLEKTNVTKTGVIKLIKSGAFDRLEKKPRTEIMTDYLNSINTKETETSVTFATVDKLRSYGMINEDNEKLISIYYFHKYISEKKNFYEKVKNKNRYILPLEERVLEFFKDNIIHELKEDVDYEYADNGSIIYFTNNIKKAVDRIIEPLTKWLYSAELKSEYNKVCSNDGFDSDWSKYCSGTISTWEMDSVCFYRSEHELVGLNEEKYDITNFFDLPQEPQAFETYFSNGREFRKFQLYRIAGTVLGRDKNKHTISLLTNHGVVKVKFYQGAFTYYDKQISEYNNETEKNETKEKTWFGRGNKLFIVGYRRDDQFIPRKYASSIYQHTVMKITDIQENGDVKVLLQRNGVEVE